MTEEEIRKQFREKFPAIDWFDSPEIGIDHEEAAKMVEDFIIEIVGKIKEQ